MKNYVLIANLSYSYIIFLNMYRCSPKIYLFSKDDSYHVVSLFFFYKICLEFYQKKRARWPFPAECIPWEVWTVKLDLLTLNNESGKMKCVTPE
jgi:hypothetical protein